MRLGYNVHLYHYKLQYPRFTMDYSSLAYDETNQSTKCEFIKIHS